MEPENYTNNVSEIGITMPSDLSEQISILVAEQICKEHEILTLDIASCREIFELEFILARLAWLHCRLISYRKIANTCRMECQLIETVVDILPMLNANISVYLNYLELARETALHQLETPGLFAGPGAMIAERYKENLNKLFREKFYDFDQPIEVTPAETRFISEISDRLCWQTA